MYLVLGAILCSFLLFCLIFRTRQNLGTYPVSPGKKNAIFKIWSRSDRNGFYRRFLHYSANVYSRSKLIVCDRKHGNSENNHRWSSVRYDSHQFIRRDQSGLRSPTQSFFQGGPLSVPRALQFNVCHDRLQFPVSNVGCEIVRTRFEPVHSKMFSVPFESVSSLLHYSSHFSCPLLSSRVQCGMMTSSFSLSITTTTKVCVNVFSLLPNFLGKIANAWRHAFRVWCWHDGCRYDNGWLLSGERRILIN